MVRGLGAGCAVAANLIFAVAALAAPTVPSEIEASLAALRMAALSGKTAPVDALVADDFSLVSQSGKVYAKVDALTDLRGGFEVWENRDVAVQMTGNAAVVTLINRRKRTGLDVAEFRVMQIWQQKASTWQLTAQSSTALTAPSAPTADLSPQSIIERAYAAAGGDTYRYPGTLQISGSMIDYKPAVPVEYKPYSMSRVQPRGHPRGRVIDGKIRISAYRDGKPAMQIAFDGATTYNMDGPTGEGPDAPFWRTTMGFGMIRFALSPGYKVERLADDRVDNAPTYTVRVTDAADESAVFSVRIDNARLVKVVFPTPRGVHERIFSDFFTKPGISWVQPGRVRSYINGIKETEFRYTDFEIGKPFPDDLFVIKAGQFSK